MTADEQHSNNARTDDETTTVAGQDDTTQHTGAEGKRHLETIFLINW